MNSLYKSCARELKFRKTAFIDEGTPGSDQRKLTIIGGVPESADQHVHITDAIGFATGASASPQMQQFLHTHRTAEVFFVLKVAGDSSGTDGTAGEVIPNGDIFNIPTPVFRGFENVGDDYGMIMAVPVAMMPVVASWAPQVLEDAKAHGLVLGTTVSCMTPSLGSRCLRVSAPCNRSRM